MLKQAATWARSWGAKGKRAFESRPAIWPRRGGETTKRHDLETLRAEYVPALHGRYVDFLAKAIRSGNKNIALAGGYGVGKSSILLRLSHDRRVRRWRPRLVELAPIGVAPKHFADTEGEEDSDAALQKAVVKQLLYSARPQQLPRSRYRRISSWRLGRALSVATFLAFGLELTLKWLQRVGPVETLHGEVFTWGIPASLVDIALFAALGTVLSWLLQDLQFREFGFGGARIAASAPDANYFDKYLDELEYFFRRTRTKLVIFEDLDRFENPGIFNSLRQLNSILNRQRESSGLRARLGINRGHPIVFVYALRDSLFEGNGFTPPTTYEHLDDDRYSPLSRDASASVLDSAASSRAKFFDAIVPVVPFISHEVSADLLGGLIDKLPPGLGPSDALIQEVARHTNDMRVLRSMVNEYFVYSERKITEPDVGKLDRDPLFALIAYKHHDPADYEKILSGVSSLDEVFEWTRRATRLQLTALDEKIALETSTEQVERARAKRCALHGRQLHVVLDTLASASGYTAWGPITSPDGTVHRSPDIGLPAFWDTLVNMGSDGVAVQVGGRTARLPLEALKAMLPGAFPVETWLNPVHDSRGLSSLRDARSELAGSSVTRRLADPELWATASQLAPVPAASNDSQDAPGTPRMDPPRFAEVRLGRTLALTLVQKGYIDQDFGLYAAEYYGKYLSRVARSFIYSAVDRKRYDPLFKLESADVEQVLSKRGIAFTASPVLLNVAIFDHCINKPWFLNVLPTAAAHKEFPEFLDIYLTNGIRVTTLIRRLADIRPELLGWIIDSKVLNDTRKRELLEIAIVAQTTPHELSLTADHVEYLSDWVFDADILKKELPDGATASAIGVISESGLRAPTLADLDPRMARALLDGGLVQITRENLAAATSDPAKIGLDTISHIAPAVFQTVLLDLTRYLELIRDPPSSLRSVDDPLELDAVLELLAGSSASELVSVIQLADSGARIERLHSLPDEVVEEAVDLKRVKLTKANVAEYVDDGELDARIAEQLDALGEFADPVGDNFVPDDALQALVSAVADDTRLTRDVKLSLLSDIDIEGFLQPDVLRTKDGVVLAELFKLGFLEVAAETFANLTQVRWPVQLVALGLVPGVSGFLGELKWDRQRVWAALTGNELDLALKFRILNDVLPLVPDLEARTASSAISVATQGTEPLMSAQLLDLVDKGASAKDVVTYLTKFGRLIDDDDYFRVLDRLGDPFSRLVESGRGRRSVPNIDGIEGVFDRLRAMGYLSEKASRPGRRGHVLVYARD